MTRYALVKPDDTIDRLASNVDPTVRTRNGWRWLPCPATSAPDFDPAAQVIEGPSYAVGADAVTESYSVRAMTAQELSAAKDGAVAGINGTPFSPLVKILLNHENRIRALEGKAALTLAQFRAAAKAIL